MAEQNAKVDVYCVQCGRQIRALGESSVCRECGSLIEWSLPEYDRPYEVRDWLARVAPGVGFLTIAQGLQLCYQLWGLVAPVGELRDFPALLQFLIQLCQGIGLGLIASPEPTEARRRQNRLLGRLVRLWAVLGVVLLVMPWWLLDTPHLRSAATRLTLQLPMIVVTGSGLICVLMLLRRLAARADDVGLAATTTGLIVGQAIGQALFVGNWLWSFLIYLGVAPTLSPASPTASTFLTATSAATFVLPVWTILQLVQYRAWFWQMMRPPGRVEEEPPWTGDRYCMSCGYNLYGLAENRCPECGRSFAPEDRRTFLTVPLDAYRRERAWTAVGRIMGVVGVAIVAAIVIGLHLMAAVGGSGH